MQLPCPQSSVPGSQFMVHIMPVQSGFWSEGTHSLAWQQFAATQSASLTHSSPISLSPLKSFPNQPLIQALILCQMLCVLSMALSLTSCVISLLSFMHLKSEPRGPRTGSEVISPPDSRQTSSGVFTQHLSHKLVVPPGHTHLKSSQLPPLFSQFSCWTQGGSTALIVGTNIKQISTSSLF